MIAVTMDADSLDRAISMANAMISKKKTNSDPNSKTKKSNRSPSDMKPSGSGGSLSSVNSTLNASSHSKHRSRLFSGNSTLNSSSHSKQRSRKVNKVIDPQDEGSVGSRRSCSGSIKALSNARKVIDQKDEDSVTSLRSATESIMLSLNGDRTKTTPASQSNDSDRFLSNASNHSLGKSSTHSGYFSISKGSTHSSRGDNVFQHLLVVDNTWEQIKNGITDYESKIGEQIVLRMMEMDPNARQEMRISSLRSSRFDELTKTLIVVVDLMVSIFGPDLEDFAEDLERLGQECIDNGIQMSLLPKAVPDALRLVVDQEKISFGDDAHRAWTMVVQAMVDEMQSGPI